MKRLTPCKACLLMLAMVAPLALYRYAAPAPHGRVVRPRRDMSAWTVPMLAAHLEEKGLKLHVAFASKTEPVERSGLLLLDARRAAHIRRLPQDARAIKEWRGAIACRRTRPLDIDMMLQLNPDFAIAAPPFLFFGDVELLDRIAAILREE